MDNPVSGPVVLDTPIPVVLDTESANQPVVLNTLTIKKILNLIIVKTVDSVDNSTSQSTEEAATFFLLGTTEYGSITEIGSVPFTERISPGSTFA